MTAQMPINYQLSRSKRPLDEKQGIRTTTKFWTHNNQKNQNIPTKFPFQRVQTKTDKMGGGISEEKFETAMGALGDTVETIFANTHVSVMHHPYIKKFTFWKRPD